MSLLKPVLQPVVFPFDLLKDGQVAPGPSDLFIEFLFEAFGYAVRAVIEIDAGLLLAGFSLSLFQGRKVSH